MRHDIRQGVKFYVTNNIKPNFAAIARQYGVDYRTVKQAYQEGKESLLENFIPKSRKPSLLDPFREAIQAKLELNCSACSAMAIFKFIQKKGFLGHYTIVRNYCRQIRKERIKKATTRVEYTPGLSAQVDWKEEMVLYSSDAQAFRFNIFLYVLPYSKLKFMTLTFDRNQDTLFECLHDAFLATGGVPEEIWFDNMKTVVDHAKSSFGHAIFNERFKQFSADAGYHPIACRPFRPQTKGVVESLARTVERLRPYNYEFADGVELINLIDDFCTELNQEVSQATDEIPQYKWEDQEKKYLHQLPDGLLDSFFEEDITRVVSKESMINFRKCKYSVDPRYIGCTVGIELSDDNQSIRIYYNGELIRAHAITIRQFNYHDDDRLQILKSDLLSDRSDQDIKAYIAEHLTQYDEI